MTKPSKRSSPQATASPGQLRIIGGDWRGRKLQFPSLPGLRPSPDRVRETLFNWLAPVLAGAHCLDLFAGSGALGLEALSRGAASCRFVDAATAACRQIDAHLQTLKCDRGAVVHADARAWLEHPPALPARLDIVFLDPPFHQQLLAPCCAALERSGLLADEALIYIEAGTDEALPALPDHWVLHRDKRAGQVAYRLFRRNAAQRNAALPDATLSAPPGLG